MANLNEAFKTPTLDYIKQHETRPVYGHICAVCGSCYNQHITQAIQARRPHAFVKGVYRQLLPFEQYKFDDLTGFSYLN